MTTDLFIKTFPGDFEWLQYCLRSIQRFATGFRRVVVITSNGSAPPTGTNEIVYYVHEPENGYLYQQVVKLHADQFTDAEFVVLIDSDTIFTRPVCPEDFITDNRRPRWLFTPYASIDSGDGQTWKEPTAKIMMRPVAHEFMRRHPFCIPAWALREFRAWMWRIHGMSIESFIMGQMDREFSEFNAIGAWLWFYRHDQVEWVNTDEEMGTVHVHQHYSWGGLNDDIRKNLEAALA